MIPLTSETSARANHLLADRATQGLSADGDRELDGLFADLGIADGEREALLYEIAAAGTHLAAEPPRGAMPAHLAQAIQAAALSPHATSLAAGTARATGKVVPIGTAKKPSSFVRALPWMAAAACFLAAVLSWVLGQRKPAEIARPMQINVTMPSATAARVPSAGEQREALLARAKDIVTIPWSRAKDATASNASGDIVWSDEEQKGFMRFSGLAVNDPKAVQYQLWIFDGERDDRFPIDGGVFDIDKETGDVIVPIAPKLGVRRATLFAVTVEKAGGVVVSKRDRIAVTAAVKKG